jgi:hypothetical protein
VEEGAAFIQAVRGEEAVLVTAILGKTGEWAHGHVLRFRLVGRRVRKALQRANG